MLPCGPVLQRKPPAIVEVLEQAEVLDLGCRGFNNRGRRTVDAGPPPKKGKAYRAGPSGHGLGPLCACGAFIRRHYEREEP